MEDQKEILTSSTATILRIIASGVGVLLLCFFVSILIGIVFQDLPISGEILFGLIWAILPVMWAIGAINMWRRHKKESYLLDTDSLVVQKSSFSGNKSNLYRYDSIVGVAIRQSFFGKRYNYGTIIVSIPRLNQEIRLEDVINPQEYAKRLKAITTTRSSTKSLVV